VLTSLRRPTAASFAAVVICSLAVAAVPLTARPASATAPGTRSAIELVSSELHVHSSTHHKLVVAVDAETSTDYNAVTVAISLPKGGQSHSWRFQIPSSLLKESSSGATLTMHNAQLAPYGLLKLVAKNTKKASTTTCGDGDYAVAQPVSLVGRLFFNTKSTGRHRWGGIGNKNKNITFKAGSLLTTEYGTGGGCDDYATACSNGPELTVLDNSIVVAAQTTGRRTLVSELRQVTLNKPKGATRTDEAVATANKPAIVIDTNVGPAGEARLTLTTPKSSVASGGFQMASTGAYMTTDEYCHRGGVDTEQQDKAWESATYTKGNPDLRFPEQIFGALTLPQDHQSGGSNFRILSPDPSA
jgi:hypothetical protein